MNGKKFDLNKPWLLLTAPLIGGCVWLASHPQIITDNINQPYALLAGPALVASILLGWLVIKFFAGITTWCKSAWQAFLSASKNDGSALFFWLVIVVFMIVSVFASGDFFDKLEKHALPGLGYATALLIDLIAVQSMRARLNAVRMRDKKGSQLYLAGVLLCSGASAFANVYTSLKDFDQTASGALPPWMVSVAPWFGLIFPAMILLLSITADYTLDQVSTKLDPEQYKEQEAKRTKLLEYQLEALQQRTQFEAEIDRLTHRLKTPREFFLVRWLLPKAAPNVVQVVDQVVDEMRSLYDPQLQILVEEIKMLRMEIASQPKAIYSELESEHLSEQQNTDPIPQLHSEIGNHSEQVNEYNPFTEEDYEEDDVTNLEWMDSELKVNTDPSQIAHTQRTTKPRITVKLRNTDDLTPANKSVRTEKTASVTAAKGDAVKRVERILKRTPDITPTELAKRAKVSKSYASEVRKKLQPKESA